MKDGVGAERQYEEVATALRELDAAWLVDEVEEIIAHGKTVQFRDLPREEQAHFSERLAAEVERGFSVGKPRQGDQIGVGYQPSERLSLLVEATERVVTVIAMSHRYISQFASQHGVDAVTLLKPVGVGGLAGIEESLDIPIEMRDDVQRRLSILSHLLVDEVLE